MANKKVTRPGSGRTKGSTSFVLVSLSSLTDKFKDPNTQVLIGRKFAAEYGLNALKSGSAMELSKIVAPAPAAPAANATATASPATTTNAAPTPTVSAQAVDLHTTT